MTKKHVSLEEENGVFIITINRAEVLNALNWEAILEIGDAIDEAVGGIQKNSNSGALIITGQGEKAFCSGADIKSIRNLSTVQYNTFLDQSINVLQKIWRSKIPTIAALNGYALGGGCELALACDIRIAASHAKLGLPELALGMVPGWGGVHFMSRLIGRSKTLELVLKGELISAEQAVKIGLVNRVVEGSKLMDEAKDMAGKMIEKAPLAVQMAKEIVNNYQDADIETAVAYEALCSSLSFASEDAREGMEAFINKRRPVFKGK